MPNHSTHKVGDLAGDERLIVERWLGRALSDGETISVNVYRAHAAPDDERRAWLRERVVTQAREIGSRAGDVPDQEIERMLEESFDAVRGPGR